ncbi:MAG: hypothetical protein JEZ11_09300 [Desulfobacterales bacterium]|nr:hypothetical protein [Desulfobacterales bacterium]
MDKKKKIAAVSAVIQYIRTEEEALMMQAQATTQEAPQPLAGMNLWGASGRQSMMQLQNLMQLKAFHGSRFR